MKNLSYFMRDEKPEIITAKGPVTFKDENGNVIDFEIKVLTQAEINRINNAYRTRTIACDKKGNPIISNGEVVFKTDRDYQRTTRHLIVEALQYPNLKDKELMDYYKCVDVTEMPLHVFSKPGDFEHVTRLVMSALGIGDFAVESETNDIEDAKN